MSELILCNTEDGRSHVQLRADQQGGWVTQLEMAELFDASKQNIFLHLKNMLEDGDGDENSVVKESLTTSRGSRGRATVKQSLTVALSLIGQATAEESSAVGSAGAASATAARRA